MKKLFLIYLFCLISNFSSAQYLPPTSSGGSSGSGVSSLSTTCPASGPATGAVTLTILNPIDAQTVTTYNIPAGDCGGTVSATVSGAATYTLPTTLLTNQTITVKNEITSTANVTVSAGSNTIDANGSTLPLKPGQSATFVYNATTGNWVTTNNGNASTATNGINGQGLTSNGAGAFGTPVTLAPSATTDTTNAANISSGTLPAGRMPALTGDCTTVAGAVATSCGFGNSEHTPQGNTGFWFQPSRSTGALVSGSTVFGTGKIGCMKAAWDEEVTLGALGVGIGTVGTSNIQMALYSNILGRPGLPLSSTANVADTSLNTVTQTLGVNVQVGPGSAVGRYVWKCVQANDATVKFYVPSNTDQIPSSLMGASIASHALTSGGGVLGVVCTTGCNGGTPSYGSWPNLTSSTWTDVTAATTGSIVPGFVAQVASQP